MPDPTGVMVPPIFSVNATDLPASGELFAVNVAVSVALPPYVPAADTLVTVVATPADALLLVKLNLAAVATPVTLAVTVYEPLMALAVKVGAVAMPLLLVVSVTEVFSPENTPLTSVKGAAKVTVTPLMGLPF